MSLLWWLIRLNRSISTMQPQFSLKALLDRGLIMRTLRENAVVCFSGGLDSYVMLRKALKESRRVNALYVNYGSKHAPQERIVASKIAGDLGVPFCEVSIPVEVFQSGSALIDGELPLGRDRVSQGVNPAYVPNRNMVIASLAASLAITRYGFRDSDVCMGFHFSDGAAFVDTTSEASDALNSCLLTCTSGAVSFFSFAELSKDAVLRYAVTELGLTSEELARTRSCYQGFSSVHCGVCDACIVRHRSFVDAGIEDLTEYAQPFED